MPTIDIIIRNKTASAVNPPCIVCGNSDYNVKFDFDDEWQAHNNKIGVFAYNRCGEWQSEKVLFEGDTCPVPALHGVRSVWIGVTAGDVRTSTPADVPCRMGATDFSDAPEKPSEDIWGQILDNLDELQTEIDEIKAGGVGGTDISLGVTATVGQTIKVKAVDADGKPTAWEAVDMATGEMWERIGILDSSTAAVLQLDFPTPVKKLFFRSQLIDTAGEPYSASNTAYRQVALNVGGTWRDVNGFKIGCCKHAWGWSTMYWLECGADLPIAKGEWSSTLSSGFAPLQLTPFITTSNHYTAGLVSGIRFSLTLPAAAENTASGNIEVWGVKA